MKTNNPDWGFYGTIKTATGCRFEAMSEMWDEMFEKLQALYPMRTETEIQDFLDSRIGRHLADEIGVNQGNRKVETILKIISGLTLVDMDKWWDWYYEKDAAKLTKMKNLYKIAIAHKMSQDAGMNNMKKALGVSDRRQVMDWLAAESRTEADFKRLLIKLGY